MVLASIVNLAYATAMIFIGLSPGPRLVGIEDWLLHALAFGLQAGLLSLVTGRLLAPFAAVVGAAVGALLCGTVIEVLQGLVFGSQLEAMDLIADAVGVALTGALLARLWAGRGRPRPEDLP